MADSRKFRFDLTQEQTETILEATGESVEALELKVENVDGVVTPRGYRMI